MKSSSPKSPCPICGRTKGTYCRWDDHRIFCYQGNSCHPPRDLRPGEVVTTDDGVEWGFVGYDKGFSHNSAMFTLHQHREGWSNRPLSVRQQRRKSQQESQELNLFSSDLHDAHILVAHALACPSIEHITPDELKAWRAIILEAFNTVVNLKPRAMKLKRLDPKLVLVISSLEKQIKELSYQFKDIDQFIGDVLMDPVSGEGKKMAEYFRANKEFNPFDHEPEVQNQIPDSTIPIDFSPEALGF